MLKTRLTAFAVLAIGAGLGWFVYAGQMDGFRPFRLGLDLSGGTQLIYRADVSSIPSADVEDSISALRDTVERRVNLFGVSEPIVQTETSSAISGERENRLVVELPGVTDTAAAVRSLGETPVLEFRMLKDGAELPATTPTVEELNALFDPASITGRHLERAELQFNSAATGLPSQPVVALTFNNEGAALFEKLTRENVGKYFGIFLDSVPISIPVIQEAIPSGTAIITGGFTAEGARELARNLNFGALPVPIELVSTQTVSGTLGGEAVNRGIMAGGFGILAVMLFMILWYRLPGLVASVALLFYVLATLALFQLIPVTLTAAGIAAFILSVGMAVDANVLIFERLKEEMRAGKHANEAVRAGFARAWLSIRDSNISSMITAVILFWFGTSLVKGFALVFGLGVLVSMISAITVSRTLLLSLSIQGKNAFTKFLLGSGIRI